MDLEARSLPPEKKTPLLAKLREYKADIKKIRSDFKKSSVDMANRAELGLVNDTWSASSAAQRERLLATTDRINQSGDRIKQSKQTLLETEVCTLYSLEYVLSFLIGVVCAYRNSV